jgi:hypothetical protein
LNKIREQEGTIGSALGRAGPNKRQ